MNVTLGGGYSLGISKDNRLIHFKHHPDNREPIADLGPATKSNIESLRYALERLEIHTSE